MEKDVKKRLLKNGTYKEYMKVYVIFLYLIQYNNKLFKLMDSNYWVIIIFRRY